MDDPQTSDETMTPETQTTEMRTPETQTPEPRSAPPRIDRRRLARGGSVGLALLLLALLAGMVNYLGWKYHHRFDWTKEQLYSLSEKTRNALDGLDRDVEVVALLQPGSRGGFDVYEATRELLERYDAASSHLSVRWLDPARNLLEAQQFVDRHQLDSSSALVLLAKNAAGDEDRRVVTTADLVDYDFSPMQMGQSAEVAGFKGEQAITRALLDLTEGAKPRVLFTTGHGEISLDDRTPVGLGAAQRLLGDDNFELEEWASLGAHAVPDGTDLLVLAGPTGSFLPPELEVFDGYLAAGGRMLILLDPPLAGPDGAGAAGTRNGIVATGLEDWLAGYGVDVGYDVVVDPSAQLPFYGPETIFVGDYPASHPITRAVSRSNLPVLVSLARSVGRGNDVPEDLDVSVLVQTSADGWGETDLQDTPTTRGPDDVQGPVPMGVVVEERAQDAGGAGSLFDDEGGTGDEASDDEASGDDGKSGLRLVVYGDSTFASDQLVNANPQGNGTLLADTVNWLVERQGLLGVAAKKPEQVRLTLSISQVRWLYLLALGLLPGLGLILGVVVYYRRRR